MLNKDCRRPCQQIANLLRIWRNRLVAPANAERRACRHAARYNDRRSGAYLPRSPAAEGGGGGVLTADASQVDVALQLLVRVTGCPAWNGVA